MQLKLVTLYCTHQSIDQRKEENPFPCTNCPSGMVGANIGYVFGLLVHGKVVAEFGRKVFLVDCLKTINIAKIIITERTQS